MATIKEELNYTPMCWYTDLWRGEANMAGLTIGLVVSDGLKLSLPKCLAAVRIIREMELFVRDSCAPC